MARLGGLGALVAVAGFGLALGGCSEIRMSVVNTQERVVSTRKQVVPSDSAIVRARVDGTVIVLQATRACDLVAVDRVQITEELGPDEDLTEEAVILALGAIPLGIGIGLLVDAPNVHDRDRNAREYNQTGPTGAYVAGTILTSLGGLIVLAPIVQMLRVASAGGEYRDTLDTRQGEVVQRDVACQEPRPVRTTVVLRVGGSRLATPGTDNAGLLELDLAEAIPPELLERAVVVEVLHDDRVIAEVPVSVLLEAQRARRQPAKIPEPLPPEPLPETPEGADGPPPVIPDSLPPQPHGQSVEGKGVEGKGVEGQNP